MQTLALNTEADELFYGGAAGGGKANTLDTPLLSINGYTTIGNIKPNDILFDDKGNQCKVIATSDVMYNHKIYEVVFDDGSIIKADADHRWHTFTDKDRNDIRRRSIEYREKRKQARPKRGIGKRSDLTKRNQETALKHVSQPVYGSVVTTQQIKDTLLVGKTQRTNHAVPVTQPLVLPKADLPIEPYILGYWLGDGCSYGGSVTIGYDYIEQAIDLFDKYGYPLIHHKDEYDYGITGLTTKLRKLNLIKNKHIPQCYMLASTEQRIELLQGLMDTDGYACKDGQCEFYSSRKNIIDDVSSLLATLGIKHTIRTKKAPKDTDYGISYRIKFVAPFKAFKFDVKANRQNTELRETQRWHYIVDVREVPSEPVKCLAVDSPSHLFLIGKSNIPTHNTDLLLGVAGTRQYRSIIFRRIFPALRGIIDRSRQLYNRLDDTHLKDSYNESLHIWRLADGRQVEFGAIQRESGVEQYRGRPHDFYGWDEITEFTEYQYRFANAWNRSVRAGQRCRVIATGNPPNTVSGQWVVSYWSAWLDPKHPDPAKDGELRWFANINGEDRECTDGGHFLHDKDLIKPTSRTFIPARLKDNPQLSETNYKARLQSLPEPFRSQMLDGNFNLDITDEDMQVIPSQWILVAQGRWQEYMRNNTGNLPHQSAIGVDVAYGGNDKTVIVPRYGNFYARPIILKGKDTPTSDPTVERIKQVLEPSCQAINIDTIGYGSTVYENLCRQGYKEIARAVNVAMGSKSTDKTGKYGFNNLRSQLYWQFREMLDPLRGVGMMLPPDDDVMKDLCSAHYTVTPRGYKVESKDEIKDRLKRSPDVGDAILLASYVQTKYTQLPSAGGTRPDYGIIGKYAGLNDRQQQQSNQRKYY